MWKTKYPDDYSTTIRHVVRKVATMEGRLVWFGSGFHCDDVVFGQVDLYMTVSENGQVLLL